MKRSEVTVEILKNMGWRPTHSNLFNLEKIVFNLQDLDYWKYLRCRVDDSKIYEEKEFGMCSTYVVAYKYEYFEVSENGKTWRPIMVRDIEVGRRCTWAE